MEVGILLGLAGIGYLHNKKAKKNVIDNNINKDLPIANNIYESDYYNKTQSMITDLVENNFNLSFDKDSKIINKNNIKDTSNNKQEDSKEGMDNYIYSNSLGGLIPSDTFLTNDQGVRVAPFFSKCPSNINYDDNVNLSRHMGRNDYFCNKTEKPQLFEPQKNNRIFGNYFEGALADHSRYDNGMLRTNELPFEQQRISHIDVKSDFNRDIGNIINERLATDNLRTLNNPKMSFAGKVKAGHSIIQERGKEGIVFKNKPEKDYQQKSNQWLVTNGSHISRSLRPEEIVPDTNRQCLNKQEMGIAGPSYGENLESRPKFKKSLRQQLGSDTSRNVGSDIPFIGSDLQKNGYRALPNERDVTHLRNYSSNISTEKKENTIGILDDIKNTKKQTTLNPANNGYLTNEVNQNELGIQDKIKNTKKQTTLNSANNGYIVGAENDYNENQYESPEWTVKDSTHFSYSGDIKGSENYNENQYEAPSWTVKDSTHFSYTGDGKSFINGNINKQNYDNAESNPTKEIIAQGRTPTTEKTKLANGMDTINMDIKKIDIDIMNHRLNGVDKVYNKLPERNTCNFTTDKDTLNNERISNRIEPALLNPFRDNPYTQPLSSFA
jgi:hypothetical protein